MRLAGKASISIITAVFLAGCARQTDKTDITEEKQVINAVETNVYNSNKQNNTKTYTLKDDSEEFISQIIIDESDYIKDPKDSGYSSYHLNILIPVYLLNVTEYIEDYSFSSLDVLGFKTPKWAKAFFETGSKLSAGYLGNYNGRMVAVIGFDLHNTDFPLQTEFPIFMYNLLRETMSARIAEKSVYNAGEAVSIQKKGKSEKVVVTKPDGTKENYNLEGGTVVFADTIDAGLYSIKEDDGEMYFIVPFPEEESDVLKETVITSDKNTKTDVNKTLSGSISKKMVVLPVLALLLVLLMAEWIVYRKRL